MAWPFNNGTMNNPETRILAYYTATLPSITIQTPPEETVRSPADATIETVELQPNGLYAVSLSVANSDLVIKLSQIAALEAAVGQLLEGNLFIADVLYAISEDSLIGTLGPPPTNILELSVAQHPQDPANLQRKEMVDPLPLLPALYAQGVS